LAVVVAYAAFTVTALGPSPEARAALDGSSWVTVTETSYGWRFQPANSSPETGFVLIPGGRVDARSYAPLASEIAARGHVVAIVKVPLELAVLKPNAPDAPLDQETGVKTWTVGGHSLGGVMAARYAGTHPADIAGLVLLASYPDDKTDLSASGLAATSVVGSADGVLDTGAWNAAKPLLPAGTEIVEIQGGNHSQFGSYGLQDGDNPATISAADQQKQVSDATNALIGKAAANAAKP
jgi:pimeloyl-ACP methyl ester carboxylesterase